MLTGEAEARGVSCDKRPVRGIARLTNSYELYMRELTSARALRHMSLFLVM